MRKLYFFFFEIGFSCSSFGLTFNAVCYRVNLNFLFSSFCLLNDAKTESDQPLKEPRNLSRQDCGWSWAGVGVGQAPPPDPRRLYPSPWPRPRRLGALRVQRYPVTFLRSASLLIIRSPGVWSFPGYPSFSVWSDRQAPIPVTGHLLSCQANS